MAFAKQGIPAPQAAALLQPFYVIIEKRASTLVSTIKNLRIDANLLTSIG